MVASVKKNITRDRLNIFIIKYTTIDGGLCLKKIISDLFYQDENLPSQLFC